MSNDAVQAVQETQVSNTGETQETQRAAKVVFDEAQQEKVNLLIREAMGRAGREARTEAAALRKEVETLRSELGKTQTDAKAVTEQARETAKRGMIESLGAKLNYVKPEQLTKLVGEHVVWSDEHKVYVTKNVDGTVVTDASGKPASIESYLTAFASENGHLIRGDVKPGVGSTESRQWSGTPDPTSELRKLFGRGSNAMAANALAQRNPAEYKRLKEQARRQGLIQ